MSRPCKRRRICAMPGCGQFGPMGPMGNAMPAVVMTLDEYEAVRLIDLEGLTQEQCARQMNVARTTAQAVYGSARAKLAECLVNGRELRIAGGQYELCDGTAECGRCCGRRNQYSRSGGRTMTIAVTYENGQVYQHFGHTECFKLYQVQDGRVTGSSVADTNGSGHGALAGFLSAHGVDTLLCGGIGGGARNALEQAGIALYGGGSGEADKAVEDFLAGRLAFDPEAVCAHHGEHHDGGCGEHGCGHHEA